MMTERENYLRAATFQNPEWIPINFAINKACYFTYDQNFLFDEMEKHKLLFPNFKRPQGKFVPQLSGENTKGARYYDGRSPPPIWIIVSTASLSSLLLRSCSPVCCSP